LKKKYFLIIILSPFFNLIAQEQIDVIYLNNGDIAKGIIIENVLDDYVKIGLLDGSIFTFKYSDILLLAKEEATVNNPQYPISENIEELTSYDDPLVAIILNGGINMPLKPVSFNKEWNPGFNIGGGVGYVLSDKSEISLIIDYSVFNYNSEIEFWKEYNLKGGEIRILTSVLGFKFLPFHDSKNFNPFISIGLGYYMLNQADTEIRANDYIAISKGHIKNGVNILFEIGVNFSISNYVKIFAATASQQIYTNVQEFKSVQLVPFKIGIYYLII
jgi:outer membrane protein W